MQKNLMDIDKIFDEFLADYIKSNRGKYTEKEWENKIPALYDEFGVTPQKALGGVAPEHYYDGLSGEELAEILKEHIEQDVAVSDFLCEAIIRSKCDKALISFISINEDEELVSYCVNLLSDMHSSAGFDKYFDLLLNPDCCDEMRDLLVECMQTEPEAAKERAILEYAKTGESDLKIYLLEVLSHCKKDDRILKILLGELTAHKNGIQLYLPYVTKYGDEAALPKLLELIKNPDINYLDFKELKLAIEGFGGEFNEERDFSNDRYYKKLKGDKKSESDLN